MMVGLQGAGKTTTTAKIAGKLKSKGKKSLLVACDVYRPAAIEQLKINGEKQGVEVFSMGDKTSLLTSQSCCGARQEKRFQCCYHRYCRTSSY